MLRMKKVLTVGWYLVLFVSVAWARPEDVAGSGVVGGDRDGRIGDLDIQCTIDFIDRWSSLSGGLGGPGTVQYTGGTYNGNYGGFLFTNTCTPGDTMITFCIDIHDPVEQNAYCVNIENAQVGSTYPEQYKAMAYVMTWHNVSNAITDDMLQLAIWKLSPKDSGSAGPSNPTFGKPYYRINAGRGYPNIADTPHAPFVNTVYNTNSQGNTARNDSANAWVLEALGPATGGDVTPSFNSVKNVIFCDDELVADIGAPSVHNGISTVPVTLHLGRGDSALAVGNTTLGGVKFLVTADVGTLSATQLFTNAAGTAEFTISQPYGTTTPSMIRVCSRGGWPQIIRQCAAGTQHQTMVKQFNPEAICELCVTVPVLADQFLDVELASFSATAADNAVQVNWVTSSEQNNLNFRIRRDGQLIYEVAAANLPTGARYAWSDVDVQNGRTYEYGLSVITADGSEAALASANATPLHDIGMASDFSLAQNFPNPFNPETEIAFTLPVRGFATLTVYDLTGRELSVVVNAELEAGLHRARFQAAELPSGVYFYKLTAPGYSATKKMVLMK